jgi:hypothetical protein
MIMTMRKEVGVSSLMNRVPVLNFSRPISDNLEEIED